MQWRFWEKRSNGKAFKFRPHWKEELEVTGPGGAFSFVHTYFPSTVYLPSEKVWRAYGPVWAKDLWQQLHDELAEWCLKNATKLEIDTAEPWNPMWGE